MCFHPAEHRDYSVFAALALVAFAVLTAALSFAMFAAAFAIAMATAADTVIAEAEMIVELGEIAPEDVRTSGVFVDYVVEGGLYQRG